MTDLSPAAQAVTDFRALCVELTDCLEKADWPHRYKVVFQQWANIAHAALAESDGPAVPDGREPASVATQPSDEELLNIAAQTIDGYSSGIEPGEYEAEHECAIEIYGSELCTFARAVLARWGRPTPQPVAEGAPTVTISDLLNPAYEITGEEIAEGAQLVDGEWLNPLLGCDSLQIVVDNARAALARWGRPAAAPVPVSERLPEPEDCDAEGRCWRYMSPEESMGNPMWELARSKYAGANYGSVAWLPANALPLPAPEGGESQP